MPSGDAAAGTRLLNWPRPPGSPEPGPPEPGQEHAGEHGAHADAEAAYPWHEQVPPPGGDATLLAVVPIPGTGTSLAIVGYVIATSAGQPQAGQPQAGQPQAGQPQAGQPQARQPQARQSPGLDRPSEAAQPPPEADVKPKTAMESAPGLRLDHRQRRVWADGCEIQLTFQEFELLAFLTAHPAMVFTRADLVDRVWHGDLGRDGRPVPRDSRTVDVHVSRLRHKLGPRHGQCLVTEYRAGYQFRPLAP